MSCASWEKDRRVLEREVESKTYRELLEYLHRQHYLLGFKTWMEVVRFMWESGPDEPARDKVLRPILRRHRDDRDPRWRTLLLLVFWPDLEVIHRFKWRADHCAEERWQNLLWTFFQVILRIDVDQRPEHITRKLFNDSIHGLSDTYRKDWAWANTHSLASNERIAKLAGWEKCPHQLAVDYHDDQHAEVRRLRSLVVNGNLSENEFDLLVATCVFGQSLAEYARDEGLDYEMLKKRRQRATAKADALKKTRKT